MNLALEHLSKQFGAVIAVDDVSLGVRDGEFLALLGPSGCGKTTVLWMIAGIYRPSAGRILFDGECVNGLRPQERGVGLVFQSYALYPHLSAFENIAFPLRVQRVPMAKIRERVRDVAALVGIEQALGRRPGQLSGGQQQRVALCRAIVKRPKLLLLDEPLSNLDARLREGMRAEIRRLQKDLGITAVFVSHDQTEALGMADRVGVMRDGKLMALLDPGTLYRRPSSRFVAEFVGNPPMNFVSAQVNANALIVPGCARVPLAGPVPPGRYDLGVRPEHLALGPGGDLPGKVVLVESLGRERLVHVRCEAGDLRVLVQLDETVTAGDSVAVRLAWREVHLFDAESGQVIATDLGGPSSGARL